MVENINSYVDNISNRERALLLNKELNRWLKILISQYNPQKILLFGSLPQKKVKEWSDIDLIIIKETNKPFLDRIKEVLLLLEPKVGTDLLVYTPAEYDYLCNNRTFFKDEIVKKGVVLYERGS